MEVGESFPRHKLRRGAGERERTPGGPPCAAPRAPSRAGGQELRRGLRVVGPVTPTQPGGGPSVRFVSPGGAPFGPGAAGLAASSSWGQPVSPEPPEGGACAPRLRESRGDIRNIYSRHLMRKRPRRSPARAPAVTLGAADAARFLPKSQARPRRARTFPRPRGPTCPGRVWSTPGLGAFLVAAGEGWVLSPCWAQVIRSGLW